MKTILLIFAMAFGQVGGEAATEALRSSTFPTEAQYNEQIAQLNKQEFETRMIKKGVQMQSDILKKFNGTPNEVIIEFYVTCNIRSVMPLISKYDNVRYAFDHKGEFPPSVIQQRNQIWEKCEEKTVAAFASSVLEAMTDSMSEGDFKRMEQWEEKRKKVWSPDAVK